MSSSTAPEERIGAVLQQVCPRAHMNTAPAAVQTPYLVWQVIPGGRAMTFLNKAQGDKVHLPVQVGAWGDTPEQVIALIRAVEQALLAATTVNARPLSAYHSGSDEDTGRHSAVQDFEIFAPR